MTVTTKQLAESLGVSIQRVYQWSDEGLAAAAKLGRGKWDEERAREWVTTRRAGNLRDPQELIPPSVSAADIVEARARLYKLQGDGAELRNAILRGELITRELVEAALAELGVAMLQPMDEWVRAGGTSAQIARNQELAHDLRNAWVAGIETVRGTLDAGEDLGPTRVRLPRRMG